MLFNARGFGNYASLCSFPRLVSSYFIIIIIIIITVFIVRGLQDWPMAHYNCSYGVEMHIKIEKNKIK